MALVKKSLETELKSIYEKGKRGNPSPVEVGTKTGKAYMPYMQNAQNAMGY